MNRSIHARVRTHARRLLLAQSLHAALSLSCLASSVALPILLAIRLHHSHPAAAVALASASAIILAIAMVRFLPRALDRFRLCLSLRHAAIHLDARANLNQQLLAAWDIEQSGRDSIFLPMLHDRINQRLCNLPAARPAALKPRLTLLAISLAACAAVLSLPAVTAAPANADWQHTQAELARLLDAHAAQLPIADNLILAEHARRLRQVRQALDARQLSPADAIDQLQLAQQQAAAAMFQRNAILSLIQLPTGINPADATDALPPLADALNRAAQTGNLPSDLADLLLQAAAAADHNDLSLCRDLLARAADLMQTDGREDPLAASIHLLEKFRQQAANAAGMNAVALRDNRPATPPAQTWQRLYAPHGLSLPPGLPAADLPADRIAPAAPTPVNPDEQWLDALHRAEREIQGRSVPPRHRRLVRNYFSHTD